MVTINGNNNGNDLNGTSAADTINGYGGSDRIHAGAGDDVIYGGGDFPLASVDRIWGDDGNDTIHLGKNSANIAYGGWGNDIINGSASDDTIYGEFGNDTLTTGGGTGEDKLYGGDGHDILRMNEFGGSNTTLDGGDGNDIFYLNYGVRNFFVGGYGTDTFYATRSTIGQNHFDGGAGNDAILAFQDGIRMGISTITGIEKISSQGFINMVIQLQPNTLINAATTTYDLSKILLEGVAETRGTSNADIIYFAGAFDGDSATLASDDVVTGESGHDTIYTGFGADRLDGGTGNDSLFGGSGSDTFEFKVNYDHDTIGDFVVADDFIRLTSLTGFDDFSDIQALAQDTGSSTIINFGNGDILEIVNISLLSLTADNFLFA
jgi:Ca2+-binding RTX toxin-like protein